MKVMNVLVALDGSREAETALPKAVELVKRNDGAKVVLVRAVDPATLAGAGAADARLTAINEAAEYLGDVAGRLRDEGVQPIGRSVWYGAACRTIADVARAVKSDVIVMAARHRDDAGRLAPGSIAECVLRRARVPVLLVAAAARPVTGAARGATVQEGAMGRVRTHRGRRYREAA
jgi:nucleotide-binding universal stress UspA family protein